MIQMQTVVDVADNTGAKEAQVITVLGGSTSRKRKKSLRTARIGDIIVVTVKKALPNSDFTGGSSRKDRATRRKARAVVVRTRRATRRPDGSYVRFDSNAVVLLDENREPRGTRISTELMTAGSCTYWFCRYPRTVV